jgi:hypothetical protein
MTALPGSHVIVSGWYGPHWFEERFEIAEANLLGRVPVPRLAGFTMRDRIFCRADERRDLAATVRLASPPGAAGAHVDVVSSLPGQGRRTVWLAPGQREASFAIPIPRGAEGRDALHAAAGGVLIPRTLRVHPPVDCAPGEDPSTLVFIVSRSLESDLPDIGGPGQACARRSWPNQLRSCDADNLQCVDGRCGACGRLGEPPCPSGCAPGLFTGRASGDTRHTCMTCGSPGGAWCRAPSRPSWTTAASAAT